jgi:hypothetical protein
MAAGNTAVFGILADKATAEAAVDRLTAAGFSIQDVSVLMSDTEGSKEFARETKTKAQEGATTRVGVGGVVGGRRNSMTADYGMGECYCQSTALALNRLQRQEMYSKRLWKM